MTASDPLLLSVLQLRSEIEGIDAATREFAVQTESTPAGALSFSAGPISWPITFSSADEACASLIVSVQSLLAKLAPQATLETTVDGLQARSILNYGGRVTSVFAASSCRESQSALIATHLEWMSRTYALRTAFAGAIAAAGSTLLAISHAVANPLSVLHALSMARHLKQALEKLAVAVEKAT